MSKPNQAISLLGPILAVGVALIVGTVLGHAVATPKPVEKVVETTTAPLIITG